MLPSSRMLLISEDHCAGVRSISSQAGGQGVGTVHGIEDQDPLTKPAGFQVPDFARGYDSK